MSPQNAAQRRRGIDQAVSAVAQPGSVRVVIVAERLFGEGLAMLFHGQRDITTIGAAAEAVHAITLIRQLKPDVVLLDPGLPETDYTDVIRLITRHAPDSRVLLLPTIRDGAEMCRALRAGARGYVAKNAGVSALTKAIHGVHKGDVWIERKLIAEALWGNGSAAAGGEGAAARAVGGLTAREREILQLLATGGTNRRIAATLLISEKTVKTHLNSIFRKLNVTRRLQAVLCASRLGVRGPHGPIGLDLTA
jgi:DNA-binding NarL/FixJ family response regulator